MNVILLLFYLKKKSGCVVKNREIRVIFPEKCEFRVSRVKMAKYVEILFRSVCISNTSMYVCREGVKQREGGRTEDKKKVQ